MQLPVKMINKHIDPPTPAHTGDAGFDLTCPHEVFIAPHERVLVGCGIAIAIPKGYAGLVLPRSGLANSKGITVANAPGLIDSGYRGEVKVALLNTSNHNVTIEAESRVAQLMIVPFASPEITIVDKLDNTERGAKGFGSTGMH